MSSLKIVSLNCRGLHSDAMKRRDIFLMCREKYDIALLVDTHSSKEVENNWRSEWGYTALFSSHNSRSRGVAILFKNSFKYEFLNTTIDPNGNFIIVDIKIQEQRFTLSVVYGPNEDKPDFYKTYFQMIENIDNTSAILAGDWNVTQNYEIDNLNYRRKNNPNSQKCIKEYMEQLDLIDIWRVKNLDSLGYTWKGPNNIQARLDYFLVSTDLERFVEDSDIQLKYKSDHNPVSLEIKFINQPRGRGTWKFNNSLLNDNEYVNAIKTCIAETIDIYRSTDNDDFTINDQLMWETLKIAIRGKTISYSSYKKRQMDNREAEIETKLRQLYKDQNVNADEINRLSTLLKEIRETRIKGIVLRSKAKWKVEGEKSSRYFCNLEKRHFSEKIIPKIITDDKEITEPDKILNEQMMFYKNLYSSSNCHSDQIHEEMFFDENNPYLNQLNEEERESLEGPLSENECLLALKNMKNNKSPGMDGFTVEFYKFFWKDIGSYVVKSLNHAYENQELSITQKQGLITCIPKEGKSKLFLKNWRPISLLQVDLKIASSAIANRLKSTLGKLISDTQSGFVKGRYIGDCNRLISDILEKANEDDLSGLLVLLDFEKAFDSVEWNFIEKALVFFGFGNSIIKWFRTFYRHITSCVISNGHLSDTFTLERGVRQGDPLSPYLFILSVELLSAALKLNPNINGMKIDDSEYLISQYADDSTLILDDNDLSLHASLDTVELFANCSGLKANFDKTQAIWFGAKRGCGEEIPTVKPLTWNHEGKFKLLGITYDLQNKDMTSDNFRVKIGSIKKLLNDWCYRNLSLIGKVTVIKTLALPILIQCLTVLGNPPIDIIKEIEQIFFKFLWNGKPDKIKRSTIINTLEEGGLKMVDLKSFSESLQMSWLKKLLDVEYKAM